MNNVNLTDVTQKYLESLTEICSKDENFTLSKQEDTLLTLLLGTLVQIIQASRVRENLNKRKTSSETKLPEPHFK